LYNNSGDVLQEYSNVYLPGGSGNSSVVRENTEVISSLKLSLKPVFSDDFTELGIYCSSFVSSSTFSIVISSLGFEDDEVVLFDDVKDA